jgi:pyruvate-formate lyase-activating enzyme
MKNACIVVSDQKGNIFEIPEFSMAAASGNSYCIPQDRDLITAPRSSVFYSLPGRIPVGYDTTRNKFVAFSNYNGIPVSAVAAFMPPGYIRTLSSAYQEMPGAPRLPLFCYAAMGWKSGRFVAAGYRIDPQTRHTIADSSMKNIYARAQNLLARHPGNRLVSHLVNNCVFKYRCPNACNLALGKSECPIPVSSACNASCVGCISHQPRNSGFPSTQNRIDFVPTAREIIEYVVPHLKAAADPIASFGQGCEGEPLLHAGLIIDSIRGIRAGTGSGIININTNASIPYAVEKLCAAGLNSMRVSLNSAQADFYNAYYRPKNYSFKNVRESIVIAKRHSVWVSLNYLVFPGFTDHPSELTALKKLVRSTGIDMIQTRNLNIDPKWFIDTLGLQGFSGKPDGMRLWIEAIRGDFPEVKLGYFNPTLRTMRNSR